MDGLAPYCRVVGSADLDGERFALVATGPARLDRESFAEVTDALKGKGQGSWWRDQKVWIVREDYLPRVAAALDAAFPEEERRAA